MDTLVFLNGVPETSEGWLKPFPAWELLFFTHSAWAHFVSDSSSSLLQFHCLISTVALNNFTCPCWKNSSTLQRSSQPCGTSTLSSSTKKQQILSAIKHNHTCPNASTSVTQTPVLLSCRYKHRHQTSYGASNIQAVWSVRWYQRLQRNFPPWLDVIFLPTYPQSRGSFHRPTAPPWLS